MYAALDLRDEKPVAIKKLKKKFWSWEHAEDEKEIKFIWEIYHKYIVLTREIIFEDNYLYIVMESATESLANMIDNMH